MTQVKSVGISKTLFVVGLIAAILASSLISAVIVTQLPIAKGPKGDKGDTGATGLQGPPGESRISNVSFVSVEGIAPDSTSSTIYGDIKGASLSIVTEKNSSLLIVFSAALDGQSSKNFSGYVYLRAFVDGIPTSPNGVEALYINMGEPTHDPMRAFVFDTTVIPGTHSVTIQWMVATTAFAAAMSVGSTGTLQVLALPLG